MPRVSLVWVILLVMIAALAGYWAKREDSRAAAGAQLLAETEKKLQADDRLLTALNHRVTQAETARAKAEAKLAAPSAPVKGAGDGGLPGKMVHLRDLVRDHPEFEAARMMILRRDAQREYGDRLAAFNLAPDQLDRLKNLLVERQLARGDAAAAAHDAGLAEGSQAYFKATADAQASVDEDIAGLIGKDQEKQLINSSGYKNQVDNLGLQMAESGVPLTPSQSLALSNMMYEANQGPSKTPRSQSFYQSDPTTGLSGSDQIVLDQAGSVVSPEQLKALREAIISINKQQQMMNSIFKQLPPGSGLMDD